MKLKKLQALLVSAAAAPLGGLRRRRPHRRAAARAPQLHAVGHPRGDRLQAVHRRVRKERTRTSA